MSNLFYSLFSLLWRGPHALLDLLIYLTSLTFTLTLNLYTLMVLACVLIASGAYIVRYYVLAKYSRLPVQPQSETINTDSIKLRGGTLHDDIDSDDSAQQEQKYLPEEIFAKFLSSIKIFQYLDKAVLMEFARNSQQRPVYGGQVFWRSDDDSRDLVLVMQGHVQVFIGSASDATHATTSTSSSMRHAPSNQSIDSSMGSEAQLLNELSTGGTVSSLFDVLNIYLDEQQHHGTNAADHADELSSNSSSAFNAPSFVDPSVDSPIGDNATHRPAKSTSRVMHSLKSQVSSQSILFAKAVTTTTLLVIPEQVFRTISMVYPAAATQIVHVIITRFQRVTFFTLYKYLGFTKELIKIEQAVNEYVGTSTDEQNTSSSTGLEEIQLTRLRDMPKKRAKVKSTKATDINTPHSDAEYDNPLEWAQKLSAKHTQDDDMPFIVSDSPLMTESWEKAAESRRSQMDLDGDSPPLASPAPQRPQTSSVAQQGVTDRELRNSVFESLANAMGVPLIRPLPPHTRSAMLPSSPVESRSSSFAIDLSELSEMTSTESIRPSSGGPSQQSFMSLNSHGDIQNDMQIFFFEAGSTLIKQGERNAGLYFVIDGTLEVLMRSEEQKHGLKKMASQYASKRDLKQHAIDNEFAQNRVFLVRHGGLAGYLSALTGHPSFVTVRAKSDAYVGFLSKVCVDRIVERYPNVLLTFARRLINKLPSLVWHIDFALEWVQINAGKVLYRQEDPKSDAIYIVLNGRLRSTQEQPSGELTFLGEYGQGESVGELEVLTNIPRASLVYAIRDTELARMPKTLFNALALRHPEITIQISRIIASRSMSLQPPNSRNARDRAAVSMNLKTVALLPVNADVPINEFVERLREAFVEMNTSLTLLDSATVVGILGRHAFSRMGQLKLLSWLTEQEEQSRLVLYVADAKTSSPWTQWCMRQADCILVLALANADPRLNENEKIFVTGKSAARKELVLIHPNRLVPAGTTRAWLKKRPWITAHHHVCQCLIDFNTQIQMSVAQAREMSIAKAKNALDDIREHFDRLTRLYHKFAGKEAAFPKIQNGQNDFARLGRRLTGRSIGLALGGGGARGIAHVGVIQAFKDANIPIDMVGGVSIGSLIGGLYSANEDMWFVYWKAKEFSSRVSSVWRQVLDLTYPLTSWFSGNEFNRSVWKCFGDHSIEDSWLSYFCITTNITDSKMEVHTSGYIWRYVRASMSLSGFLPPLCDNGNMLLDGGYLNNLPGDIIRERGADMVIAIDVGSEEERKSVAYGDYLNGWMTLLHRCNPFGSHYIPSLADIQSRLAYVSCVKQLEEVKNMDRCIYLRPPVGHYGTLDFGKFEEIYQVGYKYGQEMVKEWEQKGMFGWQPASARPKRRGRRNSV